MKKLSLLIAFVACFMFSAYAETVISRNFKDLPVAAFETITSNFKAKVSLVKIDKTMGKVNGYEVILSDGSEISFDRAGNWKEVEVGANNTVPSGFLLKGITEYVKNNHPKAKIVGVEKERNQYEVELSNNVKIKFDHSGKFLKYDN